jgi:hypothetical protein
VVECVVAEQVVQARQELGYLGPDPLCPWRELVAAATADEQLIAQEVAQSLQRPGHRRLADTDALGGPRYLPLLD